MEGIIQEQIGEDLPDEVIDIDLEGWKSKSLSVEDKKLLEKYSNLDSLSFSGCGLESLENFPQLGNLVRLDLSENSLKTGLAHLKHLSDVMQINLENNKIETIDEFAELAQLEGLIYLMVEGNPVASTENFREKLFELIPNLQIIDGLNKDGEEVDFGDDDDDDVDLDDDQSFSGEELDDDDDDEEEDDFSESEEPLPRKKQADQKGKKK